MVSYFAAGVATPAAGVETPAPGVEGRDASLPPQVTRKREASIFYL